MAVHGRLGKPKYQCDTCQRAHDYNHRRYLRCGLVRAEDWLEPQVGWGYIGGAPIRQPETCPGYTTTLDAVQELAELWAWWKRGQLAMRADVPEQIAALISIFNGQIEAARAYYIDEHKPKR